MFFLCVKSYPIFSHPHGIRRQEWFDVSSKVANGIWLGKNTVVDVPDSGNSDLKEEFLGSNFPTPQNKNVYFSRWWQLK